MQQVIRNIQKTPYIGPYFEKPDARIAVIRMAGIVADSAAAPRRAGISYHRYAKLLEKAFSVRRLTAVALMINSPGGAPAQCALIGNLIRCLADEKEIPVYSFVEDVAASGGYWLACAGDEIYVQDSSIVGSVGVISAGFGLEDFIKRYDIKRRIYASGKDKAFLDPFTAEKSADLERMKTLQADIHQSFKLWVKERRGKKLKGTQAELLEGAFWTGGAAVKKGLVDGIGDLRATLQDKYGKKLKLIEFVPEKKFLPFMFANGAKGGAGRLEDKEEWLQAALQTLDDKAIWARYSL